MTEKREFAEKNEKAEEPVARRRPRARGEAASVGTQHAAGNLAVQRLLHTGGSQTELAVSREDDPAEREAEDEAARAVADSSASAAQGLDQLSSGPPAARESSASSGRPLDAATRASMEGFFGQDLGPVRIHTGPEADASARSLNALAYTVGSDVVFREGEHAPGTAAGKKLLAHELSHVVSHSSGATLHRQPAPKAAEVEEGKPGPGEVAVPEPGTLQATGYLYPWQYQKMRDISYRRRDEALSNFLRTFAEIEIDQGLMPVQDVTADEITAERESVKAELQATEAARKADPQNLIILSKKLRLEDDLKYLDGLPKGALPTGAAALQRVKKRWTAYVHSKKADVDPSNPSAVRKDLTHDELLGRVLDHFDADPDFVRFPKWVRYMVVHFSGMRYLTAHGTYAPASELVKRLKTEEVRQSLGAATEGEVDERVITAEEELMKEQKTAPRKRAAVVKERLAGLGAVESTLKKAFSKKGDESKLRAFEELQELEERREVIRAHGDYDVGTEAEIETRIAENTKLIGGPRLAATRRAVAAAKERRRKALLEHEIERAQNALASLDDTQALAVLRKMRSEGAFPDWFWRQVVRATALRLEQEDDDWAEAKPDEAAARRSKGPVTRRWVGILNSWKKDSTAWLAKHGTDRSLVVSSAVCNQIAEQSLHARGVNPAGGISQKVTWYVKGAARGTSFSRPEKVTDLATGASLFFLDWESSPPKDNVNKVRFSRHPMRNDKDEIIRNGMTDADGWTYQRTSDDLITRTRPLATAADPTVNVPVEKQWLNWTHEAVVVEVDEKRNRVVTFETGPTGINKRSLTPVSARDKFFVLKNWRVYIGHAPSGPEPAELDKYLKDLLPGR